MFISVYRFSVCFVFLLSFFVIKSEVIEIAIRKLNGPCLVSQRYNDKNITANTNFTLIVNSDFLICENYSTWRYGVHKRSIDNLYANISIFYTKSKSIKQKIPYALSVKYIFSYTDKVNLNMKGNWDFQFCVVPLNKPFYNPLYHHHHKKDCIYINCSTSVKINEPNYVNNRNDVEDGPDASPVPGTPFNSVITISSAAGLIILSLTAYIIYMQIKFRGSNKMKTMHRSDTAETVCDNSIDIAKRPPLPLPKELNNAGPLSPGSPALQKREEHNMRIVAAVSPRPDRHQNYGISSGSPALQKREEHNMRIAAAVSPRPVRHQNDNMRTPLPLQPRTPKDLRKTARTCPMTPVLQRTEVQNVGFAPAVPVPPRPVRHQYNDAPPILSPKPNKRPAFQADHQRERRDSSDDDWQYEKLQPVNNYINNRH